ncbi:MAG: nucleotidyltransferase family protein [Lachnospiraceae bacterium]|nr:nucleotidyltransferase family protein [Lachnospiraceae bacterium]
MAQETQNEILTAQSQVVKDLAYLVGCSVNGRVPEKERIDAMDAEAVLRLASRHTLGAAAAMALESGGCKSKETEKKIIIAVRRAACFEAEWETIKKKLEEAGIWYLPLKGAVIKSLYPQYGMREMADHDILFDATRAEDLRNIMEGLGYTTKEYGRSNHDAYHKPPVLNFEMHKELFDPFHDEVKEVCKYYRNTGEKLLGDGLEKHFSDEDFYLYLVAHEYKHYCFSGTGLRSLLDIYVYLSHKTLDLEYVAQEARKMGCAEYERINRELALALFGDGELTAEGEEMLTYIVSSGTYGTNKQRVQNKMKRKGWGKSRYVLNRFFVPVSRKNEAYDAFSRQYPTFYKHKILLPFLPFYRTARAICGGRFGGELKSIRAAGADGVKPDEGGEKNAKKND